MRVAVIGAGTMGAGIAQVIALGGCPVMLHDTADSILRRALARISRSIDQGVRLGKTDPARARRAKRAFTLTTALERCTAADLVIEAVAEDRALKLSVLRALDDLVTPETILATSTNTLSVSALAAGTRLPERVVGLHFCNPPHLMRLVEVVQGEHTRPAILDRAMAFVRSINRTPVLLPDVPGLIVNRVGQVYYGEALRLLDDAGVDVPTVDRLMEALGFPMGPFRLMDFVGVDTAYDVSQALYEATFHEVRYRPHPRQRRMVEAGQTGRRVKPGFYPLGSGPDQG
ncbi:MAG: 3-hydroxyacyl-CoA dehydrogenase family protein [Chloroflexi bacterium]|nr:3-hydroxyacyl-CoA dehydrogenase family protein [Chloroflexota bacterium]